MRQGKIAFFVGALVVAGLLLMAPNAAATGDVLTWKGAIGPTTLRVIAMRKADWIGELRARRREPFSLAFEPILNSYRGRTSVELRAQDIQWDAERLVERR